VIYRVKGILDIQIQHDRDSSTSARPFQEALQFGDLPLCASVRPEAFLHFVYRLVLFYGAAKIAVHHLGKNYKLGAWLTSRSKVRHLKCSEAFGQECDQRSKPFLRMDRWIQPGDKGVDRCLQKHNERRRTVLVKFT
jgi:hypothetical protein